MNTKAYGGKRERRERGVDADWRKFHARAFTKVELIALVCMTAVLAMMFMPKAPRGKAGSSRIKCVNNLKNVGLAFRIFATDNDDKFPWETNSPAFSLMSDKAQLLGYYRRLSNELSTPKLLICPADKEREEATNFATLRRQNVSYFLAPNAREVFPQSFLAGDRNLTTNGVRIGPGRVELKDPAQVGWDESIHKLQGNAVMGDGSVQQLSSARLKEQLRNSETNTVLLVP
jgi:hypothetical protein